MSDKDLYKRALELHKKYNGKWEILPKVPLDTQEDLSLYYSPGVAEPCLEIQKDVNKAYIYTNKANSVAIVSDGSAVLGLGDIGPTAGLPVMEGKAILLKKFGNVDAVPICIDTKDTQEIINFCKLIAPSFGGIHLEDISAPRCVEIETTLIRELSIPVFHDDQHGTAIVVSAALKNAAKLLGRKLEDFIVTVAGTGAAGSSIIKNLHYLGIKKIRAFNMKGALHKDNPRAAEYDFLTKSLLKYMDSDYIFKNGSLGEIMEGADVFIGVSKGGIVSEEMITKMNKDPIIFAMANPTPEIDPTMAKKAGAKIVGTGRSDYPNQINNILAFPGIFRGALDAKATTINQEMISAAITAIADSINEKDLREDFIVPSPFNLDVPKLVAKAVKQAAINTKVTRD